MMKKMLLIPILFFSSCTVYAAEICCEANPVDLPKKQLAVFLGVNSTAAATLPFSPEIGIAYNMSNNYYFSDKLSFDQDKNVVNSMKLGAIYVKEQIQPFAEVAYNLAFKSKGKSQSNNNFYSTFDYGIGLVYKANNVFMPYVKLSDYLSDKKREVAFGGQIHLYNDLGLDVSYSRKLLDKSATYEGDIIYEF
jgi:hypothetical protein